MRDHAGEWLHADDPAKTNMVIQFFTDDVENERETQAAQEKNPDAFPVFETRVFVHLQVPGDSKTKWTKDWEKGVKPEIKAQFKGAYDKFCRDAVDEIDGTPLTEWAYLPRSRVMALASKGIRSVEDVTMIPDHQIALLGDDGIKIKQAAVRFLKPENQALSDLKKENQELRDKLKILEANMETMLNMPAVEDDDEEPAKRGPGRPRKAA